jgi:short-subunit dehydrogenase
LSYEYPERLDRLDGGLQRITDITVINTLPTTVLSAAILGQMVTRNKGVIVNVSSSAAYHPLFYWAIYSATKVSYFDLTWNTPNFLQKYINWLSTILRKEYASTDITIQTVCPMMVATKVFSSRHLSVTTYQITDVQGPQVIVFCSECSAVCSFSRQLYWFD